MSKSILLLCLLTSSLCFSQQNNHYLLLMTTSGIPVKDMFSSRLMLDSTIFYSSDSGFTRLIPSFKVTPHSSSARMDYESLLLETADIRNDYSLVKHRGDSVESSVIRNDTCFYMKMTDKEYQQSSVSMPTVIELYSRIFLNFRFVYSDSAKVICGYKCHYGQVLTADSNKVVMSFWYAPDLRMFSSPLSHIASCPEFIMEIYWNFVHPIKLENLETQETAQVDLPALSRITINRIDIIDHFVIQKDKFKFIKVGKDAYIALVNKISGDKWVREMLPK